jgi:hypothetical protein
MDKLQPLSQVKLFLQSHLPFKKRPWSWVRRKVIPKSRLSTTSWEPRTAARRQKGAGGILVGTGIAYAQRNNSTNAVIAEVEINPTTGRIWVTRYFVGSDYGLIINLHAGADHRWQPDAGDQLYLV